jgi:hypothetical protein
MKSEVGKVVPTEELGQVFREDVIVQICHNDTIFTATAVN